ncbi:hypothetical protein IW146_001291 [Coemansia sp. RSA 922]|nr:hypothetical protein GGI14_000662 [Coemansia sp. S680]KAJ2116746.1 hypothetical protein IW146_001291 [Coemansia sp. RSA 922]
MPFREPEFRQACFAWVSRLSGEQISDTADLLDARVLIDITTQADPEYFASASIVLSSRPGEPNIDALAQLARLLLRYFEMGLERPLTRDCVPGVTSLITPPLDDFWRLLVLVVSVTLLSERNGANELFNELDEHTQTVLERGIGSVWSGGTASHGRQQPQSHRRQPSIDMAGSDVSQISSHGLVRLSSSATSSKKRDESRSHLQPLLQRSSNESASNDSFTSVQTSFQPFRSAYSSFPSEQLPFAELAHGSSGLSSRQRSLQSRNLGGGDSVMLQQSSVHEPALLRVTDADSQSIGTIASTIEYTRQRGSLIGLVPSDSEDDDDHRHGLRAEEEDAGVMSDAESYVSEFSHDLEEYGRDVMTIGFDGPNLFAAYMFLSNTICYVAIGCYLVLTTEVPPRKSPYFKDYYDMTAAIMQVLLASIVSVVLSVIWVQIMRFQTQKVVWLTTLGVPVVGTATAVWAGTQIFRIPGAEELIGYRVRNGIVIAISLILAIRFAWSISQRRHDIERSVDIIKLACNVLLQNRELYAFSILLLAFYGVLAVVSAIFASRLVLIHSAGPDSGTGAPWLPQLTNIWVVAAYLTASFAWMSAVFVQLLRVVVSSVVCQWFFHRLDPGEPPALRTLQAAVHSAISQKLGVVVVSATILFAAKLLHLIELGLRWAVSFLRIIPVSLVSLVVGRPIYLAEGWNSYTAVYAAFSGKGYFESSKAVTELLRKHHLLHSPVVSLIKSSMTCYALLLSLVFGYALGLQAVDMLSLHSALVAIAGSVMPFALLQLVTHVLSCTVEALVVCYAIDLEVDSCHSLHVAEAMALV